MNNKNVKKSSHDLWCSAMVEKTRSRKVLAVRKTKEPERYSDEEMREVLKECLRNW